MTSFGTKTFARYKAGTGLCWLSQTRRRRRGPQKDKRKLQAKTDLFVGLPVDGSHLCRHVMHRPSACRKCGFFIVFDGHFTNQDHRHMINLAGLSVSLCSCGDSVRVFLHCEQFHRFFHFWQRMTSEFRIFIRLGTKPLFCR